MSNANSQSALPSGPTLEDYSTRITRICMARELPEEDLNALGHPERWRSYRTMVRARLRRVVRAALPRTRAHLDALGEDVFDAHVTDWLATSPPDTRFFRDVPGGFVDSQGPTLAKRLPGLDDLARYEYACWQTKAADDRFIPSAGALSFELPPVLHPSVILLSTKFAVQKKKTTLEPLAQHLCIYRTPKFEAITMELNPIAFSMMRHWQQNPNAPLTASVQQSAAEHGSSIDQSFIEGLAALLEDFLQRGILLGSAVNPTASP